MTKLLIGFGVVCSMVAAVGVLGARGVIETRESLRVMYVDYTVASSDLARANGNIARYRDGVILASMTDDLARLEEIKIDLAKYKQTCQSGLDAYAASTLRVSRSGRDETKDFERTKAAVADYFTAAGVTLSLAEQAAKADPKDKPAARKKTADWMASTGGPKLRAALSALDEQVISASEVAKDVNEDGQIAAAASVRMVVVGAALAAVVSLLLGLFIARLITRPLGRTVTALAAVARGDLTVRADVDTRDELGQLADALNTTVSGIKTGLQVEKVDWIEIGKQREQNTDFVKQLEALGRVQAVIEFKPDGTILAANDNFLTTLGYTAAEIVGRHHSMFIDPAAAAGNEYKGFWAKLARGEYESGEFRRLAKGGREVWIRGGYFPITDAAGKVQKVVKFAAEITAEKASRVEMARVQSMMEQAPINIMFADPSFVIRYVNPASIKTLKSIEHLLPIKADQILGQSIDIFHKRPEHQRRMLSDPKNLPHQANIQVGPETLDLLVSPVFDQNRNYLGAMVSWAVITEKLAMEKKIKETGEQDQARAAELQRKVDTILVSVNAMAAGDFTQQIPDLGTDVVGQMAASLNTAVVGVRTALEGVREVSEQLADASGQLASASEEIATGAQQQASSLEETASTLEEITATVKQNADSAQQARQLASGSKDVAEKGGQVVGNAVDAMSEINASSKKIAEIITAIDEIAFQTNLLALNAAVEAARAGEQGRGFAVVAAEVRNLAQRSATAAKEIKSLINDSVKKVDAGTELVNKSGQTLNEIVTSVKRVTDIVTEIAAASKEQSTGIDQVNKAVSQMDSVTQRNASQTEEMSATAQTLTEQAAQLRDLVSQFKLGGEQPARGPAAAARNGHAKPAHRPAAAPPATKPRPAMAKAMSNGKGKGHELDRLGAGGDDGFTDF